MRVQRRLLMARFTMPRDVTPRRASSTKSATATPKATAVDARIAEQSGQVGAKVHGHVPEAENAGDNGQLGPDRLHSTVESLLLAEATYEHDDCEEGDGKLALLNEIDQGHPQPAGNAEGGTKEVEKDEHRGNAVEERGMSLERASEEVGRHCRDNQEKEEIHRGS